MSGFLKRISKINEVIVKNAKDACYPYVTFGIFAVVTYPLFYFVWLLTNPSGYENLPLRMIAVFLAIPLICKNVWSQKTENLLPLYWYMTITYSLPFLFTYFLLKNNFSVISVTNGLTVIVLLILLLDTISLFIILPMGVLAGSFAYFLQPHTLAIQVDLKTVFVAYSCTIIFGYIFAHKKETLQNERINGIKQGMNDILAIIAHEIRTPLIAINNNAIGVEKVLPQLIKDHLIAKEHGISQCNIPKIRLENFSHAMQDVQKEVYYTNSTIDLLLTNVSNITKSPGNLYKEYELISIKETINNAIMRYPFTRKEAREKLLLKNEEDFTINAPKLLIENVFINLMKNALYYTNNMQNGEINIEIKLTGNRKIVIFEDTGIGIKEEYLKKIFNQFFTLRQEGVGIGLFFCKTIIEQCNGKINCESEYRKYTRFIIEF